MRKMLVQQMAGAVLAFGLAPVAHAGVVGLWQFNDTGNPYKATVGTDLTVSQADSAAPVTLGAGDGAREVGVLDGNNNYAYYTAQNPIGANGVADINGSPTRTNVYSMLWDVYYPSTNGDNHYSSLLQTGSGDGDLFIYTPGRGVGATAFGSDGSGTTGYTSEALSQNAWHRIVITVDTQSASSWIYIDGVAKHGPSQVSGGKDGIYSLGSAFDFFRDNTTEVSPLYVSNLALFNTSLSASEVAALGGASNTVPEPATLSLLGASGLLLIRKRQTARE